MNNTKKLPDAYVKNTDSNLYKLLQLANLIDNDTKSDYKAIDKSRDLSNASGKTLDYYANMFNVSRNGNPDEKLRIQIANQIGRNVVGSDCNSVIFAIAQMLGVETSEIKLRESGLTVTISGLTIEMLENSGFSAAEIDAMIKALITVGVSLDRALYAGTLLLNSGKTTYINGLKDTTLYTKYPYLLHAWYYGQRSLLVYEKDVGLSGLGTVPDAFNDSDDPKDISGLKQMRTTGTYSGGTLGLLSY